MFSTSVLIALLPALASASPIVKRATQQNIHPNGDTSKCLSVLSDQLGNGDVAVIAPCDASNYMNKWELSPGNNAVGIQLSGTSYCLDAGSNPNDNFVQLKVWQCYPGLAQQTWYYTDDQHIAITGGTTCADNGPNGPQTYQCVGGNTNQIWTHGGAPSTTTTVMTSATPTTTTVSTTSVAPPQNTGGVQLHFSGTSTGCVTIGHEDIASGSSAYINHCVPSTNPTYQARQLFNVVRNKPGPITLTSNPSLCLDASSYPNSNGAAITVYDCLTGSDGMPVPQQNWYYTDDNHLAIYNGVTCLDVVADSQPAEVPRPDGVLQTLQTWQCSGSDPEQIFTI